MSVKFLSAILGRKWLRQFYGRLEKCVRSAGKAMSIKFLVLGGGGYLDFGGGGGSADFISMGARIFLRFGRKIQFLEPCGSQSGHDLFIELPSCRMPYKGLHSLSALPSFSEKVLFFTGFCFPPPFPNSVPSLLALYRAIRLRFGYGFESCDANDPRNVKNTNLVKQRPTSFPHLVLQGAAQRGAQFCFIFTVLRTLFSCSEMSLFSLETCTALKHSLISRTPPCW